MIASETSPQLPAKMQYDPVDFVLDIANHLHVGDRRAIGLSICAVLSTYIANSEGLHIKATGGSGKGKTDLLDLVTTILNPGKVLRASASPKAFFYHKIRAGTIIYFDDYKPNDDLDNFIKNATSKFHEALDHLTVNNGKPEIKKSSPRLVFFVTSVNPDQGIEVLNRSIMIDVDDSPEQDRKVADLILERAKTGEIRRPLTDDVIECQKFFSELAVEEPVIIAIPFADKIKWADPSNRRDLSIFLDVLRSVTFWRRNIREIDENGALMATEEDFKTAKQFFYGEDTCSLNTYRLTKSARELAKILYCSYPKGLTREEVAEKMEVSVSRISQIKKELDHVPGYREENKTECDYSDDIITYNDTTKTTKRITKTYTVMYMSKSLETGAVYLDR